MNKIVDITCDDLNFSGDKIEFNYNIKLPREIDKLFIEYRDNPKSGASSTNYFYTDSITAVSYKRIDVGFYYEIYFNDSSHLSKFEFKIMKSNLNG